MKVIQMGMGGMGNAWIERLQPLDFVEYVAFVETNPTIAEESCIKHEITAPVFTTLSQAIEATSAEAVIAVIPPEYRIETLKTCIEAGLP